MSLRRTAATARRVLEQLRRDPRTIALMLVVPCLLICLLKWVFDASPHVFQSIGAALLGIFPFIVMFLVTSVGMLRERTTGTLERLLTMPLGKGDLLAGYAVAFGTVALVQAALASALTIGLLGLKVSGPVWAVFLVAVLDALLGMALGLFSSAFARTEFQAVQFLPAFVLPQLLLCGLFTSRDQMQTVLRWISDVMPLSYAVDAMDEISSSTSVTGGLIADMAIIAGAGVLALALGAATLRRRTD
ncbi:MAG: ABC transporter permease [Catenulisporales bacterium]|nr:ABC transporter permease [Catenulisporales bacterium]